MNQQDEILTNIFLDEDAEVIVVTIDRATFALDMGEFFQLCAEIDKTKKEILKNSNLVMRAYERSIVSSDILTDSSDDSIN